MKNPNSPSLLRSKPARRILTASAAGLLATLAAIPCARAQIVIPGPTTHTENFDILGITTAAWTDNTTLPGWSAAISTPALATPDGSLTVMDGVSLVQTGLLNLGTVSAADRALGSKVTGTGNIANIAYGVQFQNTSTRTMFISNITYTGELWLTNSTTTFVAETWTTFTRVSAAAILDLEGGAAGTTANPGALFTAAPAFNWILPLPTAAATLADGNAAANRLTISAGPNVSIPAGQFFMFSWVDTNLAGTDGYQGIDDFSITFANSATYNLAHAAGGSPNGVLEISANPYFVDGATGVGFGNGDAISFSQAGTATITVPADVTPGVTNITAASGTYTIGGAGKVGGPLAKSGAGTLVLNSANSFNSTAISGGTVEVQVPGALGTGPLTFATGAGVLALRVRDSGTGDNGTLAYGNNVTVANNATLDLDRATGGTSVGNTVALGNLAIGAQVLTVTGTNGYKARFNGTTTLSGTATINTNSEVILQGAISGTGFGLSKAGTGRLLLNSSANTYTGNTIVSAGSLGGSGNVGAALIVNSGATLAPGNGGNGVGIFSTNTNLTLSNGSTFSIDLGHSSAGAPVAGTDHDQVKVGTGAGAASTGVVSLTASNLALTIGTGVVAGDVFILILNDGADAVTGTFTGLAQGATLPNGLFRISYTYNSTTSLETGGNDVAVIALVPEPGTALLTLLGAASLLRRRRG